MWLKSKGPGIFFVQECHSNLLAETQWRDEWQGKIEFSHGTTNARGVMTLVTNDIPIKVKNIQRDDQGRFLMLDCVIDDSEFI